MKKFIFLIVAAMLLMASPAFSTGQTGGDILHFDNVRAFICEVTFTTSAASTVAKLPVAWGMPDTWWNTQGSVAASELAITLDLDNYVEYGDGSTVPPDATYFVGTGLDDPEFVWDGAGTNTTWMCDIVVVAAGTLKTRITAANAQDPMAFGAWGDYGVTYAIPTTDVSLGCGLALEFTAAGGHTPGDYWRVYNYADDVFDGGLAGDISVARTDLDGGMVAKPIFLWLDHDITY